MHLLESVEGHATIVASSLLGMENIPAKDRIALYRRVAALTLIVSREGPWDAMRDIALIARQEALDPRTPDALRHAALDFIAAVSAENVVLSLVEASCSLGSLTEDLEGLLAASGERTIWAVAAALRNGSSAVIADLKGLLLRLGGPAWERAMDSASDHPTEEILPLLPVISKLEKILGQRLGYKLLEHRDPALRCRVLAFLLNMAPQDAGWRRLIEWALATGEQDLADLARLAILRMNPPEARFLELALDSEGSTVPQGRLLRDLQELLNSIEQTQAGPSS